MQRQHHECLPIFLQHTFNILQYIHCVYAPQCDGPAHHITILANYLNTVQPMKVKQVIHQQYREEHLVSVCVNVCVCVCVCVCTCVCFHKPATVR